LNGSSSLLVIQSSIMRRFKAGWEYSEVEDERNEGILEINAVKSQALRSHLQLDLGVTTRPKHCPLIRRSQNLTCSLFGSLSHTQQKRPMCRAWILDMRSCDTSVPKPACVQPPCG
jgi:hypothetical protein